MEISDAKRLKAPEGTRPRSFWLIRCWTPRCCGMWHQKMMTSGVQREVVALVQAHGVSERRAYSSNGGSVQGAICVNATRYWNF